MGLACKDVVLSEAAAKALAELERSADPRAKSAAHRVRRLREVLLADCLHGEVVKTGRIPKPLAAKYPLTNLYVEDLPNFWRLLYTISHRGADRFVIVIEMVSHREYEKWFPSRRR